MSAPSRTVTNHKSYDSSSPSVSSSRRASKITVEYHKPSRQSIQEYQELLSNVNLHAAAAANYKDPFVPSRQAPLPPAPSSAPAHISSHYSSSRSSRIQDPSLSQRDSRNTLRKQSSRPRKPTLSTAPTIPETETDPFSTAPSTPQQEFSSFNFPSAKDMASPSHPPTPPRPSRANTVNLNDLYSDTSPLPVQGTAANHLLDGLPRESYSDTGSLVTATTQTAYAPSLQSPPPFSPPPPPDRMGTASRSRSGTITAKGKKGMLGFMSDFLNSNKRPEISTPYDPVHLTHVGFNSSTGEFTGLPKEWQQLLQDSGISKSEQERNPLAVMEIVKFYQEGGGDVWDKMGHAPAPGGSQSPHFPGSANPPHPSASKSVDDGFVLPVSLALSLYSDRTFSDNCQASIAFASEKGSVCRRPARRVPCTRFLPSSTVPTPARAAQPRSFELPARGPQASPKRCSRSCKHHEGSALSGVPGARQGADQGIASLFDRGYPEQSASRSGNRGRSSARAQGASAQCRATATERRRCESGKDCWRNA
jgi:p21-activated kinase 1